jgi:hypothetical protein
VPPLDRGDKDSVEGYGRISADAAIEAATMSYNIGGTSSDALGSAPSSKKVWARQVFLTTNNTYEFRLSVPPSGDYDLYLYSGTPDDYGQPVILQRSVNASDEGIESFRYTASHSGIHYVVVKWVAGSGTFSLSSLLLQHDIAVLSVSPSAYQVYEGNLVNISIVVKNEGQLDETFDVVAYHNVTEIEVQIVDNLGPNATRTLVFIWNTSSVPPGFYIVNAIAIPLPQETDIADNSLNDGMIRVKIPGDTNEDGIVNIVDAAAVSAHWYPGPPLGPSGYDLNFDINNDGEIGILDAATVSAYWTGPPKGPLAQ